VSLSDTLRTATLDAATLEALLDGAYADLLEADEELDVALAAGARLEAETEAQATELARRATVIRKLRAKIDRLLTPKRKTLIGCSVKSSDLAALDKARSVYGPLGMVRRFSSGLPTSALLPEDGTPVVLSFKTPDADALIAVLEEAARRGITGYWCWYHEPEDNVEAGQFTAAEYVATWHRLMAEVEAALPGATLKPMQILMGWTLLKRDWRDYEVAGATMGFDAYRIDIQLLADWQTVTGRDFAICEMGDATDTGAPIADDMARAAYINERMPKLLALNPIALLYFNATVGGNYPLDNYPSAAAAWRSFANA